MEFYCVLQDKFKHTSQYRLAKSRYMIGWGSGQQQPGFGLPS